MLSEPFHLTKRNLTDMIRRRSLRTRAIKMLVLDEADEMLNKGKAILSAQLLRFHCVPGVSPAS